VVITVHISVEGVSVAEVTYRSGFHVEIRVAEEFRDDEIRFELLHSKNKALKGTWEEALDRYFNEGVFDSRGSVFHGEMPRIGAARDHKSLFTAAAHALWKDLRDKGYKLEVEFP
jgi:hypothetical protein